MLEVNKFMMNGEQIDFQDAEAREEINEQVERLDGRVDDVNEQLTSEATRLDGRIDTVNGRVTSEAERLDDRIDAKPDIDDSDTSTTDTWSSSKIESEIQGAGGGGAEIDDNVISASKVWSSKKTSDEDAYLLSQINNKATIDDSDITLNKTWSSSNIFAQDNSIRENIAPLNILTTAEKTYNAGELLITANKLYKATVNIAIGDTIADGVNVEETDVATELNSLGGGGMPDLNYTTPLFTFSANNTSYTAIKKCYIFGVLDSSVRISINGRSYGTTSTTNSVFLPLIKLNAGDNATIGTPYNSNVCILEEL